MTRAYDQRLATSIEEDVLNTLPEPAFDRIAALAADIFAAPIALISLVDGDRHWFKAQFGADACGISRYHPFCNEILKSVQAVVVPDVDLESRPFLAPLVSGSSGIRFCAGAPVSMHGRQVLGTICVFDTAPHQAFSQVDHTRLSSLSGVVADAIFARRARLHRAASFSQPKPAFQHHLTDEVSIVQRGRSQSREMSDHPAERSKSRS